MKLFISKVSTLLYVFFRTDVNKIQKFAEIRNKANLGNE